MQKSEAGLPHVAVLMATYNGEKYIRQQIDSILAQSHVNVSIYIRDDRSTDQTVAIVTEYVASNPNIFLLETRDRQLKVTKNFYSIVKELDFADIDYMAYSDQDDVWLANKLSSAVAALTENSADCYASNLIIGDAHANRIKRSFLSGLFDYLLNSKSNHQTAFDHYFEAASAGCTLVLNRGAALYFQELIRHIYDVLPPDASHDWSTYAITKAGGYQWYIDGHSYIIYRQHAENAYGGNLGTSGIAKLLTLFRSGWYRKHILMVDELYNKSGSSPDFIGLIRNYDISSFSSRWTVASAISRYRRRWIHRILLFILILMGYFK